MRVLVLAAVIAGFAAPAFAATAPSFASCSGCHSLEAGKQGVGPSLAGVVGRKKASVAGYAYSPALKAKGGAWTVAELDAYLADPLKALPGTKMPIGQADPAKRAAVIALMKATK